MLLKQFIYVQKKQCYNFTLIRTCNSIKYDLNLFQLINLIIIIKHVFLYVLKYFLNSYKCRNLT